MTIQDDFKKEANKMLPLIEQKLEEARAKIEEAEEIAEQCGVPFFFDPWGDFVSRAFIPESLKEKFPDLDLFDYDEEKDTSLFEEVYNVYANFDQRDTGWQYWSSSSLTC